MTAKLYFNAEHNIWKCDYGTHIKTSESFNDLYQQARRRMNERAKWSKKS